MNRVAPKNHPHPTSDDIPFVAQARSLFSDVVASPAFLKSTINSQASPHDSLPFAARIRDPDGFPSFSRLHFGAQRHCQTLFLTIPHHRLSTLLLDHNKHLSSPLDHIRLRALNRPGATNAFHAYFIEHDFHLQPPALRYGLRAFLGVPHTHDRAFPLAALSSCHCKDFRLHPLPPALIPHAFHQLQCSKHWLTSTRHDSLLRILGTALDEVGFDTSYLKRENSTSTHKKTSTDLVARSTSFRPPNVAIDLTVATPELPSYVIAATRDANAIYTTLNSRKRRRHASGANDRDLVLIPYGFNQRAGLGPNDTVDWYRSVFSDACKLTEASGGDTADITALYNLTYIRFGIEMIRRNHGAVARLTDQKPDPTPRLSRNTHQHTSDPASSSTSHSLASAPTPTIACVPVPAGTHAPTPLQVYTPPSESHPQGHIQLLHDPHFHHTAAPLTATPTHHPLPTPPDPPSSTPPPTSLSSDTAPTPSRRP